MSTTPTLRVLQAFGVSAADGLACDEAIMLPYRKGSPSASPTIRLYTYADHSVLIGRYQHLEAEVNLEAAAETKSDLGRRPTGGGAIIMGRGQLGVAVATNAATGERPREVLAKMAQGVICGLGSLGIVATFKGKNDLEVNGRKIAGLGLYADAHGALLFHASILADLDVPFMLSVLQIPAAKLGDRAISLVKDRVCTVSELTASPCDGQALVPAMIKGFSEALGLEPASATLSPQESELATRLVDEKYTSAQWMAQRRPASDATACAVVKTSGGLIRCYAAIQGNVVKSVLFSGDFNELPQELAAVEKALKWQQLDHDLLLPRLKQALGNSTLLNPGIFLGELLKAAKQPTLPVQEIAEPARSGSCYFPEVSSR